MKIRIIPFILLALLAATGCKSTNVSSKGGVAPINEEFSISTPTATTIKQGGNSTITISLNRGPYFKRDVQLDLKTDGISITPSSILVKDSDKSDVQFQVNVARDAAIGQFRVTVTGTPITGEPISTAFVVTVAAQ
jgi:uncharacterized membrane protein